MKKLHLGFVGSGNVAWHLGPALENAGHVVEVVYSPNPKHAKEFTKRLYQAELLKEPDFSDYPMDVIFIAVSDEAIEEVARELVIPDSCIVVHTSGTVSLSKLGYLPSEETGVFYPLQTFSKKKKMDLSNVPIFLESAHTPTLKILSNLADSLSNNVRVTNSKERAQLHLAAVFACNLTNHLLHISNALLEESGMKYEWLTPLVVETFEKSLTLGPLQAQTGPAVRGDLEVLDKHMSLLAEKPDIQYIYQIITEHIMKIHGQDSHK